VRITYFAVCLASQALWLLAIPTKALSAEDFKAFCGKKKCSVELSGDILKVADETIKVNRIISWTKGGKGTRPDGGVVAASLLLTPIMPVAIFGILKQKHEYIFQISYLDAENRSKTTSFRFNKKEPQDKFSALIGSTTGLAEGASTSKPMDTVKSISSAKQNNYLSQGQQLANVYKFSADCSINSPELCLSMSTHLPIVQPLSF
jgi:hypothetical protein